MLILKPTFFDRPTLIVAEDLIGCILVRKIGNKVYRQMITEVEAYDGHDDLASHASKGKTKRNAQMFGPAGNWYTYFVYGIHWMLNIVTGPVDYPAAVLIRGLHDIKGPARLTKKLNINSNLNGMPAKKSSGLWIESGPYEISSRDIEKTKRIGVDYAGPVWSKKNYRFVLKKNFILK